MFYFINQPSDPIHMGDLLLEGLNEATWESFQASIAFVKRSGSKHVQKALSDFSKRGRVEISVGIDQDGTTEEGLRMLLDSLEDRGKIFVFHNCNNSTFHPKLYVFKNSGAAQIVIGSANLTEGGLYTNYETLLVMNLELQLPDERRLLDEIESSFRSSTDTESGLARLLSYDLLQILVERGAVPTESQVRAARKRAQAAVEGQEGTEERRRRSIADIFTNERVGNAPSVTLPAKYRQPHDEDVDDESIQQPDEEAEITEEPARGGAHAPEIILVKYVPKASARTSQVHFTLDNMRNYFRLEASQSIRLQQRQIGEEPRPVEYRQLVLSEVNKNAKIEVEGAKVLIRGYPKGKDRPILIFRRIEDDLFEYMLLMPGKSGFAPVSAYLNTLPTKRSLASSTLSLEEIRQIWPGYQPKRITGGQSH